MTRLARHWLFGFALLANFVFAEPAEVADLRRSAETGDISAQTQLGALYVAGEGVPQDYREAVKWLRRAADQGDSMAQFFLAGLYIEGKGVPKDSSEAVKWYRKAAEQGDDGAQIALGVCLVNGDGVGRDIAQGYAWLSVADANGNEKAREFVAALEKDMTAEQMAEGTKIARALFRRLPRK
jgi:TPR repeat protein